MAQFVFVTCQPGFEQVLKAEVARTHPDLRFAYSRSSFLTFKNATGEVNPLGPDFALSSVFARAYGLSLQKTSGASDEDRITETIRAFQQNRCSIAHVWNIGEEQAHALAVRSGLQTRMRKNADVIGLASNPLGEALPGDRVLDVVIVRPEEWWMGLHVHQEAQHRPWPGGLFGEPLPSDAPSRAYLKMEEALSWPGLPLRPGETALEFGCAPGGAALYLLNRGLKVIGVDPADMAAVVRERREFRQVRKQALQLTAVDLAGPRGDAEPVHWVFSDMNVSGADVGKAVAKIYPLIAKSVRGVGLTVKFGETGPENLKQIDELTEALRRLGFIDIRATQLSTNHREAWVGALAKR